MEPLNETAIKARMNLIDAEWIDIAIEPVKAVEFIYIPIRILNTGAIAGLATNG